MTAVQYLVLASAAFLAAAGFLAVAVVLRIGWVKKKSTEKNREERQPCTERIQGEEETEWLEPEERRQ